MRVVTRHQRINQQIIGTTPDVAGPHGVQRRTDVKEIGGFVECSRRPVFSVFSHSMGQSSRAPERHDRHSMRRSEILQASSSKLLKKGAFG
jgi:hypothetical protein